MIKNTYFLEKRIANTLLKTTKKNHNTLQSKREKENHMPMKFILPVLFSAATACIIILLLSFSSSAIAVVAAADSHQELLPLDIPEIDSALLERFKGEELVWLNTEPANSIATLDDASIFTQVHGMLSAAEEGMKQNSNNNNNNKNSLNEYYSGVNAPSMFVLFYAPWCNHCKLIKPVFRNASAAAAFQSLIPNPALFRSAKDGAVPKPYTRRGARFGMCDATTQTLAAKTFRVTGYPTFVFFIPVLSWDAQGNAARRMAGFPYQGGRDAQSFEFAARYMDLGLRRGFVTATTSIGDVMSLRNVQPPRVLFLVGPHKNATELWAKLAPPPFIAAALTSGKAHFGTYSYLDRSSVISNNNNNKQRNTKKTKDDSSSIDEDPIEEYAVPVTAPNARELNLLHSNLIRAMRAASRGPNGEYMLCVSDLEGEFGAIPFTGEWPEAIPAFPASSTAGSNNNKKKDTENSAAGDEDAEDDEKKKSKAHLASVQSLSLIGNVVESDVVVFIQRMSFLPVEQISAPVFQQLSQEGRYVALAVLKGSVPGRTQAAVDLEQRRAHLTMSRYLMKRRAEIRKSFEPKLLAAKAELDKFAKRQQSESGAAAASEAEARPESPDEETKKSNKEFQQQEETGPLSPQELQHRNELLASYNLYHYGLAVLKTSTGLPVFKNKEKTLKTLMRAASNKKKRTNEAAEEKLFLATIDGAVFAEFMGDLGVKESPTIVVYDTQESSVFQDSELFQNLVNLDEAWNGNLRASEKPYGAGGGSSSSSNNNNLASDENNNNNGNDNNYVVNDVPISQAIDALTVLMGRIDDNTLADVPVSMLGRIARMLVSYIPGVAWAKEFFGWDSTALVAVVGGSIFSVLIILLASKPVDEIEERKRLYAQRQMKQQHQQQQQQQQNQPVKSRTARVQERAAAAAAAAAAEASNQALSATVSAGKKEPPQTKSQLEEEVGETAEHID